MKPPAPWLTDTSLPTRLSVHLNSVARARFPYDQQRGLLALQGALRTLDASPGEQTASPELVSTGSGSVGSPLALSSALKLIVIITSAGLTVLGVWSQWRAEHDSQAPSIQAVVPVAAVRVAATPEAAAAPRSASSPAPSVAPEPLVRPAPAKLPTARLAQTAEVSRARREIAQLEQVKRTLPADPAVALRLARHCAHEFPQGLLREEREALIVLALWQLGEVAAARAGAEQFLSNYPRSSFRPRIQQCMAP